VASILLLSYGMKAFHKIPTTILSGAFAAGLTLTATATQANPLGEVGEAFEDAGREIERSVNYVGDELEDGADLMHDELDDGTEMIADELGDAFGVDDPDPRAYRVHDHVVTTYDTNNDGYLSPEERRRMNRVQSDWYNGMYKKYDLDNDGRISAVERARVEEDKTVVWDFAPERYDANNNGKLDPNERNHLRRDWKKSNQN